MLQDLGSVSEVSDWLPNRRHLCALNDQLPGCCRMFPDSLAVMECSGSRDTQPPPRALVCLGLRGPVGRFDPQLIWSSAFPDLCVRLGSLQEVVWKGR